MSCLDAFSKKLTRVSVIQTSNFYVRDFRHGFSLYYTYISYFCIGPSSANDMDILLSTIFQLCVAYVRNNNTWGIRAWRHYYYCYRLEIRIERSLNKSFAYVHVYFHIREHATRFFVQRAAENCILCLVENTMTSNYYYAGFVHNTS